MMISRLSGMVCRSVSMSARALPVKCHPASPLYHRRALSLARADPGVRYMSIESSSFAYSGPLLNATFQHFGSRPGHFGLGTAYRSSVVTPLNATFHQVELHPFRCFGTASRDDDGAAMNKRVPGRMCAVCNSTFSPFRRKGGACPMCESGEMPDWRLRAAAAPAMAIDGFYPDLPLPLTTPTESKSYQRELHTVNVAITANFLIFCAKVVTWHVSGSSAMMAEAVHSLVDTANQGLLRYGITRSKRAPTAEHPYGYMKDKFVWSLVSAVGIFCVGAGVTTMQAFYQFINPPEQLHHLTWGFGVLLVSGLVEGYSLRVAVRSVMAGAHAAGLGFREYVQRGMDPTSIAVMLEDVAAVLGVGIAGIAMGLAHLTGSPIYDAGGSFVVGLLLAATSYFLIQQNRSLLIGRSMNAADMERVLEHLRSDDIVKAVHDAKSEEIGPGIYRFKAEIEFHGDRIVDLHMERLGGGERLHHQFMSALATSRPTDSLDLALRAYGRDMIAALGAEVDRLEAGIRQLMPNIRHIDLETDRGRHGHDAWPS